MNEQIRKICGLLKKDRPEFQCAAAVVLGELKVRDPAVIRDLGALLADGQDRAAKSYALAALEKIGSRQAIPLVLPLLEHDGELREQAVRVLAALGPSVARELSGLLANASPGARRGIHLVLARVRGADATRLLLEALQDADESVVEDTLHGIRREMRTAPAKDKKAFLVHVKSFLNGRAAKTSKHAIAAALRVLGFLDDPAAQSIALSYSGPNRDPLERSAALAALRAMPRGKGSQDALLKRLLSYLDETDFAHVVGPALEVLRPLVIGKAAAGSLEALCRSPHGEVRRFAVTKLREFDSKHAVEILIKFLEDEDQGIREQATESLMAMEAARPILFERLLREIHMERAWTCARILKPHGPQFTKEQVRRLGDKIVRLLDHDQRLYEPSLFLLRSISVTAARDALYKRALRKKRTKHYEDAARTLRLLERHGVVDDEVRYELAVLLLKLTSRDPVRDNRDGDPALELLSTVVQNPKFDLFERMRKETMLTPEELFFVGYHFVEGQVGAKDFGGKVLHLVLRKSPKSQTAQRAREKLQREGVR